MSRRLVDRVAADVGYRMPWGIAADLCFYCGVPSDGVDHVPALANVAFVPFSRRLLVPCCAACNRTLGACEGSDLRVRRGLLLWRVERLVKRKGADVVVPFDVRKVSGIRVLREARTYAQWLAQIRAFRGFR